MERIVRGEKWGWKTAAFLAVLGFLVLGVAGGALADRRGHGHGGRAHFSVEVGPLWWGPPAFWWYGPTYGYYGGWRDPYPSVVVEEPRVYAEKPQVPPPPTEGYWYYCPSAGAYYPTVQTCPEAWVKVPPRPE